VSLKGADRLVDAVVVSFNSRDRLRATVGPLVGDPAVNVVVVDNASSDASLDAIADLPVRAIALEANLGFACGCNVGIRAGSAPFVLLLNPDASLDSTSLGRLVAVLEREPDTGLVGPRIVDEDGRLAFSQRRFPRIRSTMSQAVYLHRALPRATWVDEIVRDRRAYELGGSPEWLSGACMLVRRAALEAIGGLDEAFFLYCEDTDLCRRLRDGGYGVRFEPGATCCHRGGDSAPRGSLLPVLATSRIRYARKHRSRPAAALERFGVSLGALTHVVTPRGRVVRAGHARALRAALLGSANQVSRPGR